MKDRSQYCKVFQLLWFVMALLPFPAQSAMVEVRPTLLSITPAQHVAVLSLMNPEAEAAIYQVRLYRWYQVGDKQTLEPTNDLIVSPPLISLAGHGNQIVRVGMRTSELPPDEKTYRLILEEIPVSDPKASKAFNVALRISLPVFLRSQTVLPPAQLAATMRIVGKDIIVTVANKGHFTTRVVRADLNIHGVEKQEIKALSYILPDGWNAYSFTPPAIPADLRTATLTLQTDEGDLDLEASVVPEAVSDASSPAVRYTSGP